MPLHDAKSLVYFASAGRKAEEGDQSEESLGRILEALAGHAIKERSPDAGELEPLIRDSLARGQHDEGGAESDEGTPFTKMLRELGYIRDGKNWLTKKGFFEIGNRILRDITKNMDSSGFGLHETDRSGSGDIMIDTTARPEPGGGIRHLSVSHTLLNAVQRISGSGRDVMFPIRMEPEDLEEFETLEDVRAAVVYCIDLSSTMKTKLGKNTSRLEAAKRALWGLYTLNKKFFPSDSVFIVGFASLASQVDPRDIPFLKTYDAGDGFLHYTNYQAALVLSRKILQKSSAQNRRIVLITDGQPSACFIENESQKNDVISEKPYSSFYTPEEGTISKIQRERNLKLEVEPGRLVYLCYRYKKVDVKIDKRTIIEAKKCARQGIGIDSIVVGDEDELLDYVKRLEAQLRGKTYHISRESMDRVLVTDYLSNTRKVFSKKQNW